MTNEFDLSICVFGDMVELTCSEPVSNILVEALELVVGAVLQRFNRKLADTALSEGFHEGFVMTLSYGDPLTKGEGDAVEAELRRLLCEGGDLASSPDPCDAEERQAITEEQLKVAAERAEMWKGRYLDVEKVLIASGSLAPDDSAALAVTDPISRRPAQTPRPLGVCARCTAGGPRHLGRLLEHAQGARGYSPLSALPWATYCGSCPSTKATKPRGGRCFWQPFSSSSGASRRGASHARRGVRTASYRSSTEARARERLWRVSHGNPFDAVRA